jgi:transcriptional regulator with XRE-family HTH domain
VGRKLRLKRLASDQSRASLASKIGVGQDVLYEWEDGTSRISAANLFKLSIVLDCDPSVFFDGLVHGDQTDEFR